MLRQELERDCAFEFGVLGLLDDTHAAFAELGDEFVMRDGRTNHHNTGL